MPSALVVVVSLFLEAVLLLLPLLTPSACTVLRRLCSFFFDFVFGKTKVVAAMLPLASGIRRGGAASAAAGRTGPSTKRGSSSSSSSSCVLPANLGGMRGGKGARTIGRTRREER